MKESFNLCITDINSFEEFETYLIPLDNKLKGDLMEYLCLLYFKINHHYRNKKIWLYNSVPNDIKRTTNLPNRDKGIDLIMKMNDKLYAIQVKFRTDFKRTLPYGEVSTFLAQTYGTDVKNIDKGIIFTNCIDICSEMKNDKYINICRQDLIDFCDGQFWESCRNYATKSKNIVYEKKIMKPHQNAILQIIREYFATNSYGRLYMPCGTGKSLCGYWTFNQMDLKSCFICVPSLYLLNQIYETWVQEFNADNDNTHFLLIGSDLDNDKKDNMIKYTLTTNEQDIEKYLSEKSEKYVVITTYDSSKLLLNVAQKLHFNFDLAIYDEAHRTTGKANQKFNNILNQDISKLRLFMTATEKIFDNHTITQIFSMDDENIYGKIIYSYSTRMAINDDQLCDYKIIANLIPSDIKQKFEEFYVEFKDFDKFDSSIVLKCLFIMETFVSDGIKHLLIFANKNETASEIKNCIEQMMHKFYSQFEKSMYIECLNGTDSMNKRRSCVGDFTKSQMGIISSAKIFGEGVDIPICDSVCFINNKESTVDIIQYLGRCLRKCDLKPDKNAKILLPIVVDGDMNNIFNDDDNKQFKNILNILRAIASTDEQVKDRFLITSTLGKTLQKNTSGASNNTVLSGEQIDIDYIKSTIITKIFDKHGDDDNLLKRTLNHTNTINFANGYNLIDTKKKCLKYLYEKKYDVNKFKDKIGNQKNFVKFALGNKIFEQIKNKYVLKVDEFVDLCHSININDFNTYISFDESGKLDEKLPSLEYINNGFMEHIQENFNLSIELSKNCGCDNLDF